MISYAQNFEDVVLNRVFHSIESGRYIDIGAYHPQIDSVTKHFYDKGWSGINVEPIEEFWDYFQTLRPRDKNMNVVVGPRAGQVEFNKLGDSGLSTYKNVPKTAEFTALELESSTHTLPMTTLSKICGDAEFSEIEFLKIDVEGAERDVLMGADFENFRPLVIVIEAIKPKLPGCTPYSITPTWSDFEQILFDHNYEFGLFDGLNRFYFRRENPELKEPLSYPANITDGFILNKEHCLIPEQKPKPTRWRNFLSKYASKLKQIFSTFTEVNQ